MNQDGINTRFEYDIKMELFEDCLAVKCYFVSFYIYNFSGIFVYEIFVPGLQNSCSQLATNAFLEIGLVDLYFVSQTEYIKYILVSFVTDSPEQGGYR